MGIQLQRDSLTSLDQCSKKLMKARLPYITNNPRVSQISVVPNEIFATNVEFDGKVLSKYEYLSLCAELY